MPITLILYIVTNCKAIISVNFLNVLNKVYKYYKLFIILVKQLNLKTTNLRSFRNVKSESVRGKIRVT